MVLSVSLLANLALEEGEGAEGFASPFEVNFGLIFWTWLIFLTLMLPVEVRIVPTYEVVAGFGLLNSYGGLILPLIASATATFPFR